MCRGVDASAGYIAKNPSSTDQLGTIDVDASADAGTESYALLPPAGTSHRDARQRPRAQGAVRETEERSRIGNSRAGEGSHCHEVHSAHYLSALRMQSPRE